MITGIEKYAGEEVRQKASSPVATIFMVSFC